MADAHAPAADRLRPLRPSDAAVWAVGQLRQITQGGTDFLVCLAVAVVGLWLLVATTAVATALVITAPIAGLHLAYTTRTRGPQGWATERLALLLTVLAALVGMVLLFLGAWPLAASVWALACWEAFARRPESKGLAERLWSHNSVKNSLVTAGLLKPDDARPLRYLGQPRHDDTGTWFTVEVPAPLTWQDVAKAHSKLASSWQIPEERLHIEHPKGKAAGAVTFAFLKERTDGALIPARVPERTDSTQPVPLNTDHLGRAAEFQTVNVHSAIAAATGAGMTALIRYILAHALLDPRVPIYCINGKDDVEDLEPIAPLCLRYAGGASRAAVGEAFAILQEIEGIAAARTRMSRSERFPVVVIVDEWFRLRSAAERYDKAQAEEMDSLVAELAATVRALGIHMMVLMQRGTSGYLPKDQSVNFMQKVVGMMETGNEFRYILDLQPHVVPTMPGQFLVKRPGQQPTLVQVPFLDDEGFRQVCERAGRLRSDEPHAPLLPRPVVEVEPDPQPEVDDLTAAVHRVLERRGALKPSDLYQLLPEDVRPGGPNALGRRLRQMAGVRESWDGSTRKWEHVPEPRRLPVALPAEEQPVPQEVALAASGNRRSMPQEAASEGTRSPATGGLRVLPPVPQVLP